MCFDTSSSSASTQATTTTNTDARVVGGDSSTNISAAGSTINMTDSGAVHAAFGFAEHVSKDAFDMVSAAQINTANTAKNAMEKVTDAYSTAKAGEQKIFAGAALAVVGVVAAIALKR